MPSLDSTFFDSVSVPWNYQDALSDMSMVVLQGWLFQFQVPSQDFEICGNLRRKSRPSYMRPGKFTVSGLGLLPYREWACLFKRRRLCLFCMDYLDPTIKSVFATVAMYSAPISPTGMVSWYRVPVHYPYGTALRTTSADMEKGFAHTCSTHVPTIFASPNTLATHDFWPLASPRLIFDTVLLYTGARYYGFFQRKLVQSLCTLETRFRGKRVGQ